MTDRAIFEIDLDDESFKQFAQTFEKFKAESAKVQTAWKANEKLVELASKHFKAMSAPPAEDAREKAESIAEVMARWSGAGWGVIGGGAKSLATNVRSATLMLGKWSGITGLLGSLIGAGGIWGISRMAAGVSAQRTSALRLGTTYGAQAAAGAAFVAIPDAGRIIGGLSEATASQQSMGPLFALMGRDAERLRGGDPVEAFVDILPKLKGMADQGGSWGSMNERIKAMGLDKIGVSVETLRLLKALRPEDLREMIASYRENKPRMQLSEKDLKALQDFSTALAEAETTLTNLFGANLVKLTPIVEKGATLLTKVIETLGQDGGLASELLQKLDKGLGRFADVIETPEFHRQVDEYMRDMTLIGAYVSQLTQTSLQERLKKTWKYWNPFGIFSDSGDPGHGIGATPKSGGGGASPYHREPADDRRSSTPFQHRPHVGPVPMPWTTREKGGTTPSSGGSPTTGLSSSAVDSLMQLKGLKDHDADGRAKIAQYLRSGGHGMDPATTAWCAAAVGSALRKAGYDDIPQASGGDVANAYQRWGRAVDWRHGEAIQKDDVLVTTRGLHPGQVGGHVSLLTGRHDERGRYEVIEGDARNYENGRRRGHKADTDWERLTPSMMVRRGHHPQLQGQQSHVEVHDHSGEAARVSVDSRQSGPLRMQPVY